MNQKPQKPEGFYRDYVIIVLLAFSFIPLARYFDLSYLMPFTPVFIVTILPRLWFREYYKELDQYHENSALCDKKNMLNTFVDKESKVNENIARYRKEQAMKKSQAKWWEFWV